MTDIIIVGKGPAGWSCAMTARMRGLSVQVIAPQGDAGQLKLAERIDNYPGMPQVSGAEILKRFREQAIALGTEERNGLIRQIMPTGNGFMVLVENDVLESKTIVLAMGAARQKLLPGEEEQVGRGVSYCATCDGMFYRGKRIAVLSSTEQGVEEATFLASLVGELDYYSLKKHDITKLPELAKVIDEKPKGFGRDGQDLTMTTDQSTKKYDGVFVFRAGMPLGMLLNDLQTEGSYIPVDRMMNTNIPGVFAAGDCTGKPLQVPKAVGEGNVAAIAAAEYIAKHG
ncbi:MAG: NAD(P)/FAD-dependent oxidoreductase [Clostridiales bacterium]|nr:NAD(P)/FAD-dependent oxidoreductase [Clostridiales bacterium]